MASVIVIDSSLKESVKEYAQIIDGVNQDSTFSESLAPLLESSELNKTKLADAIYADSTVANLSKLTDKEFEPAFNLLIYLTIKTLGPDVLEDSKSKIFSVLLEINPKKQPTLRDRKSIKATTVISIFSTIFNLIPETSANRAYIITQILSIAQESLLDFTLVANNFGNNLTTWLKKAGSNDKEIRTTFWNFIHIDTKYTNRSLQLIKSFTREYELNLEEVTQLIKFALKSEIVDVSFLINNNVSKALSENSSDKYVSLFKKFVSGELVQIGDEFDLPVELVNSKSRILSLARFFAEANKITFKYSEIPNVASAEDFETLLVSAIKSEVIEGKLNQVQQTFTLSRVSRFILVGEKENWDGVKKALEEWKSSLHNIGQIVESSRENIVNAAS